MSNFFQNLLGGDDEKKKKQSNNNNKKNPFANIKLPGQGPRKFAGTGQSLGGSVSPGRLIRIELSQPGTLGLKVRTGKI